MYNLVLHKKFTGPLGKFSLGPAGIGTTLQFPNKQYLGSYVTEREKDDPSWDLNHTSNPRSV